MVPTGGAARDPALSVFFTLAIAVHCVFSGFIMGVQDRFNVLISVFLRLDDTFDRSAVYDSRMWVCCLNIMSCSLAFHKWAESLAVGTSLAQDKSLSRRRWVRATAEPLT